MLQTADCYQSRLGILPKNVDKNSSQKSAQLEVFVSVMGKFYGRCFTGLTNYLWGKKVDFV